MIKLASHAGFCWGVERAIKIAQEVLEDKGKSGQAVFTLGDIIHNRHVVNDLKDKGLVSTNNIEEIKKGDIVIIRAHGIPEKISRQITDRKAILVDATCPLVKRVHDYAKILSQQGYYIIVVGDGDHPEVKGIMDRVEKGEVFNPKKINHTPGKKYTKIGIISQTTEIKENLEKVVDFFVEHSNIIRTINTICEATKKRQESAIKLAREVDMMIVVGCRDSSNTKKLLDICNQTVPSFLIEESNEINSLSVTDVKSIGVTAGASAPKWIIDDAINKLKEIKNNQE